MWRDIVMVKQQNGVTLIELLITITLLGILAAQVMPLGRAWIANTQISNAEKSLVEALGKARNEALQNPEGNIGATTLASAIEVNNTNKEIIVKNGKTPPETIWKTKIPATVSISLSPIGCTTNNTINFNNNSQNLSTCTTYTITANGGTNAEAKL